MPPSAEPSPAELQPAAKPSRSHPGDSDYAIDLAHVAKTYSPGPLSRRRSRVQALRGISMRVHRGEIFGLLGPNGAGKSTLVKILLTIIRPSRCEGTLLGEPVGRKATLARVGYLPEHHRFPDYLTGDQVLDFYGALSGVGRAERRRRGGELIELVGLKGWERKKVKGYSKGMRQRLGIANSLVHDPELVVLDEPTDGVDPVGRRDIRNILVRLKDQGKTVFLNSHLLSELEMVCDRVAILVKGLVSAQGTMEELTADSRRYEIEVGTDGPASIAGALAGIAQLPPGPSSRGSLTVGSAAVPLSVAGAAITVGTDDAEAVQPILDALRRRGLTIRAMRPVRASLEDLFMKAVTDPVTGEVLAPGAVQPGRRGAGGAA